MYAAVVDAGLGLFAQYGAFVLLFAFVLEGALVGKLVPTRALFVGGVLAVGSDAVGVASLFLAAVVGATAGQLFIFVLVRRTDVDFADLPGPAPPGADDRLRRWFDRWGLSAVAVSNTLPLARGSLTVPAAMTGEQPLRFSSAALAGTCVYAMGLLAVAAGLDVALGLL